MRGVRRLRGTVVSLLFAAGLTLGALAATAQPLEPLAPYDAFRGPGIDPRKWAGSEFSASMMAGLDAVRRVQDGRLELAYHASGDPGARRGVRASALRLLFREPARVTAIEATVTVRRVEVRGCGDQESRSRARLGGYFFNAIPKAVTWTSS